MPEPITPSGSIPIFTPSQISDLLESQIVDGSALDAIVERYAAAIGSDPKFRRRCLLAMLVEPAMMSTGFAEIVKVCRFFDVIAKEQPYFQDGFTFPTHDSLSRKFWARLALSAASRLPTDVLEDLAMSEAASEGAAERIAEKKRTLQFSLSEDGAVSPLLARTIVDRQQASGLKL